ncbi:MAG: ferredoxin--NADP reductase [Magnetococcales bacterium]|nr:ferredoxin--NADP reductase [Magnetococcales bacterium]
MSASPYNATLVDRVPVTPRLAIFRIRPDGASYPFKPGQFAVLALQRREPRWAGSDPEAPETADEEAGERLIRRAYSISSGSREQEYLEFYVSLTGSGELTPRLFQLPVGGRLFVGPKAAGHFTLDRVPEGKNVLLMATGTGLAPYVSMIRSQVLGAGCPARRAAVVHGAAYSWELGYRDELESLARECGSFRYLPVISRPAADPTWSGRTGRLTEWLHHPQLAEGCGFPLTPDQTHIFLCGHPAMVEEAEKIFLGMGYDAGTPKEPGTLHREKYW